MDTDGRRTAAVVALFLILTALLIAYNAVSAPPLMPEAAEAAVSEASSSEAPLSSAPAMLSEGPAAASQGSSSVMASSRPVPSVSTDVPEPMPSQTPNQETSPAPSKPSASSAAKRKTPPAQPDINLNTATAEDLCVIPKIGPVLAGRIIEYRDQYGPLSSLEELLEVKGIGETLYQTLCQYLYLG